jgi:hypothetical protein
MIRKNIMLSMLLFVFTSYVFIGSPAFAQASPTDFEEIDAYINTKMKELGIPGAALVIVQGDHNNALGGYVFKDKLL